MLSLKNFWTEKRKNIKHPFECWNSLEVERKEEEEEERETDRWALVSCKAENGEEVILEQIQSPIATGLHPLLHEREREIVSCWRPENREKHNIIEECAYSQVSL